MTSNVNWSDVENEMTEGVKREVVEVEQSCELNVASLGSKEVEREESGTEYDKEVEAEALNAVSSEEVNGGEMNGEEVTSGELTGGEVTGGEVNGGEVTSGEVNGGEVNGEEVNGGELSCEDVTSREVVSGEVNGGEVIHTEVTLSGIEEWCREMEMKGCAEKAVENNEGGGEGENTTHSKTGERVKTAQLVLVDLDSGEEESSAQSKTGGKEDAVLDGGEREEAAGTLDDGEQSRTVECEDTALAEHNGGAEEAATLSKAGEREETEQDTGEEESIAQSIVSSVMSKALKTVTSGPPEEVGEHGTSLPQAQSQEIAAVSDMEECFSSLEEETVVSSMKAKDPAVSSLKERRYWETVLPVTSSKAHPPLCTSPLPQKPVTVQQYPPNFCRPERLVGWKNRRSIGLGRGNPVDNPRAFMFPDYPSYHPFPGQLQPFSSTPFVPYYPAGWPFMPPHRQ